MLRFYLIFALLLALNSILVFTTKTETNTSEPSANEPAVQWPDRPDRPPDWPDGWPWPPFPTDPPRPTKDELHPGWLPWVILLIPFVVPLVVCCAIFSVVGIVLLCIQCRKKRRPPYVEGEAQYPRQKYSNT